MKSEIEKFVVGDAAITQRSYLVAVLLKSFSLKISKNAVSLKIPKYSVFILFQVNILIDESA